MFGLSETILKDTICPKIEPIKIQSIFLEILDKKIKITKECIKTPFVRRKSDLQQTYLDFKNTQFDLDKYRQELKNDEEKMEFFLKLGLIKTIYQKTTYQDQQKYLLHSPSTAS